MIRRSGGHGHAVVEVMNVDTEIRLALGKLVESMAFYNEGKIDLGKVKAQFKEMTGRALRDFEQDIRTFPQEMDSEREREHGCF